MNIIILIDSDKIENSVYKLSDERFEHIKKILKLEVGDFIEVGLVNGPTGTAKIININESEVVIEIVNLKERKETFHKADLICALPRPQTLKKVLSTSATMGVSNLYLIRSEKVEKSFFHSPLLEEKNYTKYLFEGLSQGKRTKLPKVTIHNRFKEFYENDFPTISKNKTCLLAHPNTDKFLNKIALENKSNIVLAIGPEGGWNDFEINLMEEKGFVKFKLSESILRVENAVTAALSQIEMISKS